MIPAIVIISAARAVGAADHDSLRSVCMGTGASTYDARRGFTDAPDGDHLANCEDCARVGGYCGHMPATPLFPLPTPTD